MAALAVERLRLVAKAALDEQAFVDRRGILGVPTRLENEPEFGANWDVTAIREAIDEAVCLNWTADCLRASSPHALARLFWLVRPAGDCEPAPVSVVEEHLAGLVQRRGTRPLAACAAVDVAWEVVSPGGTVMWRSGIEQAEEFYRHAPAGSHLLPAGSAAGLASASGDRR